MSESSFVCELPLATTPEQEGKLAIRLEAARQVYNACLGEALRVLALMCESRDWQRARAMPRGKKRSALFREAITRFDFTQSAVDRLASACENACWIGEHLGPHEAQAAAKRAFGAVRHYALGKRGRPRFKGRRGLHSVEGKTNAAGIRWREGRVEWSGLSMAARLDPKDTHGWQVEALAHGTKYCRIVRRVIHGTDRYSVQLVQEGLPPWKATNPDNYNADGTVRKGAKTGVKSGRYGKLQVKLADLERQLASERKRAHGELANRVVALGCEITAEGLSYRSFQGHFGRSVKVRAPGMFLALVGRKAERAGGRLEEFPMRRARLSQRCHSCGSIERRLLSQRWHACACGVGPVQRDLYSGFLARHVDGERLDARQAARAWPGAEPLLRRAASSFVEESARGPGGVRAHAGEGLRADRPPKGDGLGAEPGDAVRAGTIAPESPGDAP